MPRSEPEGVPQRFDWRGWIALAWVAWFGLLYGKMILESRGAKIVEIARIIGIGRH